jgi:hypothetical protein
MFIALVACSKTARIDALRDGLADGDVAKATKDLPACPDADSVPNPCLTDLANALGSKSGYHEEPPDQAAAAALAVTMARDGKGFVAGHPDAWIKIIKISKGPGPDALRLASASRVQSIAKTYAHDVSSDDEARKLLKDVAGLPGACDTYAKLGSGADDAKLPLGVQADHSPCVQRDLARNGGPGGTYGFGLWRAASAALAFTRELAQALAEGEKTTGKTYPHVEPKDFDSVKLKTVEAPEGNRWTEHATDMPKLAKDAGK